MVDDHYDEGHLMFECAASEQFRAAGWAACVSSGSGSKWERMFGIMIDD